MTAPSIVRIGRIGGGGLPVPPVEIADAVEMFARKGGRHARLHFIPLGMGFWMVRFSLRDADRRRKPMQQDAVAEEIGEDVWLHTANPKAGQRTASGGREPDYLPLKLEDLGVTGVLQFLEKGDTWSGRGEFTSLEDALRKTRELNARNGVDFRAEQRDAAIQEQRQKRRSWLGIPLIQGGLSLLRRKPKSPTTKSEA